MFLKPFYTLERFFFVLLLAIYQSYLASIMADNLAAKERAIGKKYANLLQFAIRSAIQQESQSFATLALKTKVTSRMKHGQLQRLILHSPKHSFVHHYGVETTRAKHGKLSLPAKEHLADLKQITILNGLGKEISEVRAEQIIALINF